MDEHSGPAAHFFIGPGLQAQARGPGKQVVVGKQTSAAESAARVEGLIAPSVEARGFELVRVRIAGKGPATLQVMAERSDGTMTVDDCAELSRALSAILDVEDAISGAYVLEVSSPGIDRPLVRQKDFERFTGFEAKIETVRPVNVNVGVNAGVNGDVDAGAVGSAGQKRFRGRLLGMAGDNVRIETENGEITLPFDEISVARLVLTNDLIEASMKRRPGAEPGAGE